MFLLYHSEGCNICELVLHECYVNDLYTTTCSGVLGHHTLRRAARPERRHVRWPKCRATADGVTGRLEVAVELMEDNSSPEYMEV
jgi:hypothetical protein